MTETLHPKAERGPRLRLEPSHRPERKVNRIASQIEYYSQIQHPWMETHGAGVPMSSRKTSISCDLTVFQIDMLFRDLTIF